ncbi:hypothetical protein Tco_0177936 [Tanacetum coccineum]
MEEHMDEHDTTVQNMAEHDMNEQDMNEQPEPQPQPQRKKRGIYSLKKKNRKQLNGVTFDEHGFAIGDDQSPFALYIGAVTKAKISILIDDWRKVSKINKTQLWLEIKEHFRLKNDDCKTQVLKQCNHSWKSFKKDLRTNYMYKKLSPCDKYTFIEPNIWEEFVKMESTPEKMAKHALGKKWAKLKKNPPRLGPKGYRGNIDKWEKGRASEEHLHLSIRYPIAVIADKLLQIEAHTELINSSEVEDGVDLLIMVVGPEHGGRTRGRLAKRPVVFSLRDHKGSLCYGDGVSRKHRYMGNLHCAQGPSTQPNRKSKKIVQQISSTTKLQPSIVATNKESSTQKQTSPNLSSKNGILTICSSSGPGPRGHAPTHIGYASKEKEDLIKKLNSYRVQIHKRVFLRSSYECWMRSQDPTRPIHVDVEPRVFGESKSFQFCVPPHDRLLLFTNGWLNSSIITLFAT